MPCSSAPWARVSNPSPHNWGLKGLGPVMGVEVPGSWVGPEERRPAPSCFAHNPFEGQSQHCRALLGPVRVTPLGQKGSPGKGGVSRAAQRNRRAAKDPAAVPQLPCSIARKGRACSKATDRAGQAEEPELLMARPTPPRLHQATSGLKVGRARAASAGPGGRAHQVECQLLGLLQPLGVKGTPRTGSAGRSQRCTPSPD